MRRLGWIRQWRRRSRWRKATREGRNPLREFVYLDDVSVYSLYASKKGPITTQLTETETSSLQSEVNASAGVSALGSKAAVGSRIQSGTTTGTQVLRKSIIQTTFKELYEEIASDSVVLRRSRADQDVERFDTWDDLRVALASGRPDERIVDRRVLRRGALIEMDVELEADVLYQALVAGTGVLDMIKSTPALFGIGNRAELENAIAAHGALGQLLGGLVPVRGRSIDYSVVSIDGNQAVVYRHAIEHLAEDNACKAMPLIVAAVADEGLFWKDVRRVLFSGSTYSVLGRIGHDGLTTSWTPVRLADVLRNIAPGVSDALTHAGSAFMAGLRGSVAASGDPGTEAVKAALTTYGEGLAKAAGATVHAADIAKSVSIDNVNASEFRERSSRLQLFDRVTRYIEECVGREVDRTVAARCRSDALAASGFSPLGEPAGSITTPSVAPDEQAEQFLDCEIVAIYW